MSARSSFDADLLRLRRDNQILRQQFRRLQRDIQLKYDSAQPRVPAGSPQGGQWTSEGGSAASNRKTEYDTTGREAWHTIVSSYRSDGSVSDQTVLNRDGSVIRSTFSDSSAATGWDERHTVVEAGGSLTTFQNAGATQTVFDGAGRVLSEAAWTNDGPEPQATMQPALLETAPLPHPAARALTAATTLYTWLSSRNSPDGKAVFAFRANDFLPGASEDSAAIWVGRLTRDEVDDACPRHAEVQSITNEAASVLNRGDYRTAAEYGTAVHTRVKESVNGPATVPDSPPRDANFRAEVSFLKSAAERYGVAGTKRVDVLENPGTGTVCVYDIKTGRRGLGPSRALELASTVSFFYPGTQRIIVTETRPGR